MSELRKINQPISSLRSFPEACAYLQQAYRRQEGGMTQFSDGPVERARSIQLAVPSIRKRAPHRSGQILIIPLGSGSMTLPRSKDGKIRNECRTWNDRWILEKRRIPEKCLDSRAERKHACSFLFFPPRERTREE